MHYEPRRQGRKGTDLYGSCGAAVRLSHDPAASQAKAELASCNYCSGYIDRLNALESQVCMQGASLDNIARVYVIYMRKNPKLTDEGRALSLLLSLKGSYGCCRSLGLVAWPCSFYRTPEEFTVYVKRMEALAWSLVGNCDECEALIDDPAMSQFT